MSPYELCKKNACDAPQCPEMCRPRTCRKRPIGANRTGLEMTVTGYDTCIQQFSSVHLCVTRYITLPVLSCSLVMSSAAGPGHSWSFCGAGGGLPKPEQLCSQLMVSCKSGKDANTVSTPCVQIMTDEGKLQRILNSD